MKRFRRVLGGSLVLICVVLATGKLVYAQVGSSILQLAGGTFQTVVADEATVASAEIELVNQGATPAMVSAWTSQHPALCIKLAADNVVLGDLNELQQLAYITDVSAPEATSDEMADFLTAQAQINNDFAAIHNQRIAAIAATDVQNLGQNPNERSVIAGIEQTEVSTLAQQDGLLIQKQQQRLIDLAPAPSLQPPPPPLEIPSGSPPQLTAFLIQRYQLLTAESAVWNQNVAGGVVSLNAAMALWQSQNAAGFLRLNQLAQALSTSGTSN